MGFPGSYTKREQLSGGIRFRQRPNYRQYDKPPAYKLPINEDWRIHRAVLSGFTACARQRFFTVSTTADGSLLWLRQRKRPKILCNANTRGAEWRQQYTFRR